MVVNRKSLGLVRSPLNRADIINIRECKDEDSEGYFNVISYEEGEGVALHTWTACYKVVLPEHPVIAYHADHTLHYCHHSEKVL
jgi:hypothetical protein